MFLSSFASRHNLSTQNHPVTWLKESFVFGKAKSLLGCTPALFLTSESEIIFSALKQSWGSKTGTNFATVEARIYATLVYKEVSFQFHLWFLQLCFCLSIYHSERLAVLPASFCWPLHLCARWRVNLHTSASLNLQHFFVSKIVYGPCFVKDSIVSVVWFLSFCMLVLSGSLIGARSSDCLFLYNWFLGVFKERGP